MGKTLNMDKIGKYPLKIAIRMFKFLDEWLKDTDYSIDEIGNNHDAVMDIYNYVEKSLALGKQNDIEFMIAAFYENYKACYGNWDELGVNIPPLTPMEKTYTIEQNYRQTSIIYEEGRTTSYLPSIALWDAYEGNVDFEIIDEDIRDTYDYEWGDVTEE
jgi:hypothetical protein